MFLNRASVSRLKAAWVPPCQPESRSVARCGQDQDLQVEAPAGNVMAGPGGAAGPAPDIRHQPPYIVPVKATGNTNLLTLAVQW
jgi:hypothetical protein